MWEAIKSVLVSPNASIVLLFLVLLLLVLLFLLFTGKLSIKTKHLQLGSSSERNIIRQQVEWAHLYCNSLQKKLPTPEGYNIWRTKYILERVYDEIVDWITFNHLSVNPEYISIKQERIWATIQALTSKQDFSSEEFRSFIFKEVEFIVKKLVSIRKVYEEV